jgi:membrane fusion protein, multidrug efflux system
MNSILNNHPNLQKSLWFLACIAILGFGFLGFILLKALKPVPAQKESALLIPTVTTAPLQHRQSPLLIDGNGIVIPTAAISVSSQVNGEVISLHQNLVSGGAFKKGETLVQVDPRTFEANLKEAEANQRANQSTLEFITKQLIRLESLMEQGFIGEETLDDAISRRDQTLAAIARQDAVIQNRQLDLERTSIRAPFDGRVYEESVDVGDIVSPGRELARFYASNEVEVVVGLNTDDSSFIPGLWQQQTAEQRSAWVTVDHGDNTYQWQGYVHRVESDLDRVTRTVDVVVRIPSPFTAGTLVGASSTSVELEAPPLLVGMYTNIAIEGMTLPGHFVIPVSALRPNNTIWTGMSEGILKQETVEFVRQEGNQAVLLAPHLPEGTPIIVSDIALMSDGMRIKVENIEPLSEPMEASSQGTLR